MTQAQKFTTATAGFYVLALPLIPYFKKNYRSGPCNANLDVLFGCFVFLSALFGFIISAIARLRGKKAFSGPSLINGAVLGILIVLTYLGRF
jgi:hypothetical protein